MTTTTVNRAADVPNSFPIFRCSRYGAVSNVLNVSHSSVQTCMYQTEKTSVYICFAIKLLCSFWPRTNGILLFVAGCYVYVSHATDAAAAATANTFCTLYFTLSSLILIIVAGCAQRVSYISRIYNYTYGSSKTTRSVYSLPPPLREVCLSRRRCRRCCPATYSNVPIV